MTLLRPPSQGTLHRAPSQETLLRPPSQETLRTAPLGTPVRESFCEGALTEALPHRGPSQRRSYPSAAD
eukprot:180090-Chlamydomonas_euryale.AAC.1